MVDLGSPRDAGAQQHLVHAVHIFPSLQIIADGKLYGDGFAYLEFDRQTTHDIRLYGRCLGQAPGGGDEIALVFWRHDLRIRHLAQLLQPVNPWQVPRQPECQHVA